RQIVGGRQNGVLRAIFVKYRLVLLYEKYESGLVGQTSQVMRQNGFPPRIGEYSVVRSDLEGFVDLPPGNQFYTGKSLADWSSPIMELEILQVRFNVFAGNNLDCAAPSHQRGDEFEDALIAAEHYVRVKRRQQEPESPIAPSACRCGNRCK